jgi:hypothetical protein
MAKDLSRRSSASGSLQTSWPPTNGTDSPPPEPQQSVETSSSIHRSPSLERDSTKPADNDVLSAPAAESQPMTASNSTSPSPPPNQSSGSIAAGAVPYGTRSRNRTGTSRPNYAEDKELDIDFEVTAPAKEHNGRKAPRGADQSPAAQVESGRAASSIRRAGLDTNQYVTVQSHYKEQIPGTSTFSANLTAIPTVANQPSKKRKAANQSTTAAAQNQTQVPTQGGPMDSSIVRKTSMAAQVVAEFRESNMLSFDDCGGRLKGKKLIADDGTVLEVNGKLCAITLCVSR